MYMNGMNFTAKGLNQLQDKKEYTTGSRHLLVRTT